MSLRYRPYAQAWEAVFAADFTLDALRRRGIALASALLAKNLSCLIAYDTRFLGQSFARMLALDLHAAGIRVTLAAGPAPLPAVHHAIERRVADIALVVTARNQPYHQNGLALIAAPQHALSLSASDDLPPPAVFPPGDQPIEPTTDLRAPYLDALRSAIELELIRRVSLTIFVDAMSGTTAGMVPTLLGEGGQTRAIEINRDADPLFGRVTPLPALSGLARLKKLVRESDSHLGMALSADGTALGIVDKSGEVIDPFEITLLLASYLARQYRQRGTVLLPPPNAESPLAAGYQLAAWEDAAGVKVEVSREPDQRLAEFLAQPKPNLLIGVGSAGELLLGRLSACPDALLAGMLIVELLARSGGSLRSLLDAQREQIKV
ncbi:MAG: phosphoglucomutase [Oscillochloris sp.]|nr:phosphoglucomutase [Oscillochloris sp.]